VSLLDPDLSPEKSVGGYWWGVNNISQTYYTFLNRGSYASLVSACSKKLPSQRTLHTIKGALCAPPLIGEWGTINDRPDLHEVTLSDDEEVVGWLLHVADVVPLRVLAVLHGTSPQTKVGYRQSPGLKRILTMDRERRLSAEKGKEVIR